MRQDISFESKGTECRGWLYLPDELETTSKAPAIVMAHGFSGVKEQVLPDIAEQFSAAGFATLVFDYRHFGDSAGEPRGQLFPLDMVEDYRNGITWVGELPHVDRDRIGAWGTSFSGGLATYVGTVDRRVKAVVAQVPSLANADSRRAVNPKRWNSVGDLLVKDRIERYRTGVVNKIKVVAPEGESCVLPGQEVYDAYMTLKESAPNWRNAVTIESLEKIREFDPVSLIHLMAPTALLVIAAEHDSLIPLDVVRTAFEKAEEPKRFVPMPITHFDIYQEPWLSRAAGEAVEWFREHLA